MTRDEAKTEILRRIDCRDYLEKSKGSLYCCPFCRSGHGNDGTGALQYYPETNTCFCRGQGCQDNSKDRKGMKYDVLDLIQRSQGLDYNGALQYGAAQLNITIDGTPATATRSAQEEREKQKVHKPSQEQEKQEKQKNVDYTAYYEECRENLDIDAAVSYLTGRGISLDTAKKYGLGYDPYSDPANAPGTPSTSRKKYPTERIIIPTCKSHYVARAIRPNVSYRKMNSAGDTPGIFNEAALYDTAQAVFVTEGVFDALSIIEAGAPAIAICSTTRAKNLLDQLATHRTTAALILAFDNDHAGRTATELMEKGLDRLGIFHTTADICNGNGDPNDALIADRDRFISDVQDNYHRAIEQRAREDEERRQRTGDSMVDSFLLAVQTRKYEPVPTGITSIDAAIGGGFIRGQLILLGAPPAAGKTSLAQWIFEAMAANGNQVIYLNLEMSREQMIARSISRIVAQQERETITATKILQGYSWTDSEKIAVLRAAETYKAEIAKNIIYNPPEVTANLDTILDYIEREAVRAEAYGNPAPCVVVDYLQIIRGREREDDVATIKRAMEQLKDFAIRHNTFCFIVMANNRISNRTGDVTMESGRDSSALEYTADLQLGLAYTKCMKQYGNKNKDELTPEEKRFLTLKITKGRWGGDGHAHLKFDGATMSYIQLSDDEADYLLEAKTTAKRR